MTDSLPTIAERPAADVLIYDGHCRFCRNQVERLHRFDKHGRLAFISLHDPEVARRWPDLTHAQLMEEMYLIDSGGRRYAGAAAFRYLSGKLYPLWPLYPILHIPGSMPVWRAIYRAVARWRYRIAGKQTCDGDACKVHMQ